MAIVTHTGREARRSQPQNKVPQKANRPRVTEQSTETTVSPKEKLLRTHKNPTGWRVGHRHTCKDEAEEERARADGSAEVLGVVLRADVERVVCSNEKDSGQSVGRLARDTKAVRRPRASGALHHRNPSSSARHHKQPSSGARQHRKPWCGM